MAGRSAIVVPFTLPPALAAVRDASDRMAARGVPAHVTILFPFLPGGSLGPGERAALTAIAAGRSAFVARFERVEERGSMVWLVPADQAPFLALTAAVVDRWPAFPPFGGIHDVLIAHLTLVETDDAVAREAAASVAREVGPFEAVAGELRVIDELASGTWRTRWRLLFVGGSVPGGRC